MPLAFDGVDDAVDLAAGSTIPTLNGVARATLMGWFLFNTKNPNPIFSFSIHNGGVPTFMSRFGLDRSTLAFGLEAVIRADDATMMLLNDEVEAGAIPENTWIHLAAVLDLPADTLRLFRNGAQTRLVSPAGFPAAVFPATDSACGAMFSEDDLGSLFSPGQGEDCRLYTRALSNAEIQTIYRARGRDGIVSGLKHRWLLSEGAPGVAASGAGSIKDSGPLKRNVNPVSAPIYGESFRVIKRRRAL